MGVLKGWMDKARRWGLGTLRAGVLLLFSVPVWATPVWIYVGSFNVYDGPSWTIAPEVMSAREVAAMLFGGYYTDYAISVTDSSDWQTITHTAWVDGFFDEQYLINPAHEDFSFSASGFYDDYPAYSAWVCDHANCVSDGYPVNAGWEGLNYTNYVWMLDTTSGEVPEPGMLSLAALGLMVLGVSVRLHSR